MHDILLQASTYPERMPNWAIQQTAELAMACDGRVSLAICKVYLPTLSNWLANSLLNADVMIAAGNQKSAQNAEAIASAFQSLMPVDCRGATLTVDCPGLVTPWQTAVRARTHDLCVVPVYEHRETTQVAEGLIFEGGRPVLLLPEQDGPEFKLDRIAIAWDGSRVAARAMADSMPLLHRASSVALVQVTGEKDLDKAATIDDAAAHLQAHGIAAEPVTMPIEGDAATTLQSYCLRDRRQVLVMGAFGHSRLREFVLGGVTRAVLESPKLPVLISH